MNNQTLLTLAVASRGSTTHLTRLLVSVLHQSVLGQIDAPKFEIRLALRTLSPELKNILDRMPLPIIASVSPEMNPCQRRNQLYLQATGQFVYFLDEDCCLPHPDFLNDLQNLLVNCPRRLIVGGRYLDPLNAQSWVVSSNALANSWLKQNLHANNPVILAGNFLMAKEEGDVQDHFPFPKDAQFGGEEVLLKNHLAQLGWQFRVEPRLSVQHFAAPTARGFFARAWLHGRSAHTSLRTLDKTLGFFGRLRETQGLPLKAQMLAYMALERFSALWHQMQRLPLIPREHR